MYKTIYSYLYIIPLLVIVTVLSGCNSNVADSHIEKSDMDLLTGTELTAYSGIALAMSGTPADTEFEISELPNTPANGSVTVWYEGEEVTTNYTSTMGATAVAYSISSNISNDSDIQLNAIVPSGSTVRVTEKRNGSAYNGNPVYVSHTTGTHITVNNDVFYMSGGTD